jgi:hypothetical protein
MPLLSNSGFQSQNWLLSYFISLFQLSRGSVMGACISLSVRRTKAQFGLTHLEKVEARVLAQSTFHFIYSTVEGELSVASILVNYF